MTENKDKLTTLAELLLEKEVIFKKDLEIIFGKRPFAEEEKIISKNLTEEALNEETSNEEASNEETSTEETLKKDK